MKIEKLNDRQLRFTLTREDLASHHIKLSELSYGSEKARSLFMEMMQQAARDYDFVVNNTPLMIEAIPISADAIILIVTKVDNPEELDSRFARFSKEDGTAGFGASDAENVEASGADDILDLISKLNQLRKAAQDLKSAEQTETDKSSAVPESKDFEAGTDSTADQKAGDSGEDAAYHLTRFYLFCDLETIVQAAHVLDLSFDGPGSLFKNPEDGHYYLLIQKADTDPALFNKVCNVISEYGMPVEYTSGMEEFFREHMETLLEGNALQSLRQL